jgi:hypothetical protein
MHALSRNSATPHTTQNIHSGMHPARSSIHRCTAAHMPSSSSIAERARSHNIQSTQRWSGHTRGCMCALEESRDGDLGNSPLGSKGCQCVARSFTLSVESGIMTCPTTAVELSFSRAINSTTSVVWWSRETGTRYGDNASFHVGCSVPIHCRVLRLPGRDISEDRNACTYLHGHTALISVT